jgi:uncharacterized RDD family membrane protein YckC
VTNKQGKEPGRWQIGLRTAAVCVDVGLISALVWLIREIGFLAGIHLPLVITSVAIATIYLVGLTGWWGWTPGKMVCGLRVEHREGNGGSWAQIAAREIVGKLFGFVILTLYVFSNSASLVRSMNTTSVLWVGLLLIPVIYLTWHLVTGRQWYDMLFHTTVVTVADRRWIAVGVLVAIAAPVACSMIGSSSGAERTTSRRARHRAVSARSDTAMVDVGLMSAEQETTLVRWLDANAVTPHDYLVQSARKHRILLLGIDPGTREHLDFVREAIPDLYYKAGVRSIGLPVFSIADSSSLKQICTAGTYDEETGRNMLRKSLGTTPSQELFDVLNVIWKLNQSLPPGAPPMRAVGTDASSPSPLPAYVSYRRMPEHVSMVRWLGYMIHGRSRRRSRWSRNAESAHAAISKTGGHSVICMRPTNVMSSSSPWGTTEGDKVRAKYGRDVFRVLLNFGGMASILERFEPGRPIAGFLDQVMIGRGHAPAGFDIQGSPFASLYSGESAPKRQRMNRRAMRGMSRVQRDRAERSMRRRPPRPKTLEQLTDGMIHLGPVGDVHGVSWPAGYVTAGMFVRSKPLYSTLTDSICTVDDVNQYYATRMQERRQR